MRYTTRIMLSTLGVLLLLADGVRSADTDSLTTDKEKIAALDKKVSAMQEEILKLMKQNLDLQEQLRNRDNDEIKQRLTRIEQQLESVSKKYQSFYEPGATTTPGTGSGTIILRNRLSVMGTVILNGKSYRLRPNETVTLRGEPAGNFTYEALADGVGYLQQSVTRQLRPSYTYEIDLVLRSIP